MNSDAVLVDVNGLKDCSSNANSLLCRTAGVLVAAMAGAMALERMLKALMEIPESCTDKVRGDEKLARNK